MWLSNKSLKIAEELVSSPLNQGITRITIQGEESTGKSEYINYLISKLSRNDLIVQRINFQNSFDYESDFLIQTLKFSLKRFPKQFQRFLSSFSNKHKQYIRKKIKLINQIKPEENDWYNEIQLLFLSYLSRTNNLNFIFENIHHADRVQLEEIEQSFTHLNHLRIRNIYTFNPSGTFYHTFSNVRNVILEKPSIQNVERNVKTFLKTSKINARIITNHCYLRTRGNYLSIRLLLGTVYQSILSEDNKSPLDIHILRKIIIPASFEEVFFKTIKLLPLFQQKLLYFLAVLEEPILCDDILILMRKLKITKNRLQYWVNSGILKKEETTVDLKYSLYSPDYYKWIKQIFPLHEILEIMDHFYNLIIIGKIKGNYQLSQLFYSVNRIKESIYLAHKEVDYLIKEGKLSQAANRLYFICRISEIDPSLVKKLPNILDKLGNIYLQIGAYDNAFETFKKLKRIISDQYLKKYVLSTKKWLSINTKMAQVLTEIDAYQEALYLIREIKIKKNCDDETKGICFELIGDIDFNLGRSIQSISNYNKAMNHYESAEVYGRIFDIYKKLKNIISDPKSLHDLILKVIDKLEKIDGYEERKAIMLMDLIQLLINIQKQKVALKYCHRLLSLLRVIYIPKLSYQLALYLGDIYHQFGQSYQAINHLKNINDSYDAIHRPILRIHSLIQLGLLYKDQAFYGLARSSLEEGLELSEINGYMQEQMEIKVHLGHLYLLVHNMLRAIGYLKETHKWLTQNQNLNLLLLNILYLSYYELQNNRLPASQKLLRDAKKIVNISSNEVDKYNYLFYLSAWLLESQEYNKAHIVIKLLLKKTKKYPRYQAAGLYLNCRLKIARQQNEEALKEISKTINYCKKWEIPQIRYLTHCESARLYMLYYDEKQKRKQIKRAIDFIKKLANRIDDRILRAQFLEARFHEDILIAYKKLNI